MRHFVAATLVCALFSSLTATNSNAQGPDDRESYNSGNQNGSSSGSFTKDLGNLWGGITGQSSDVQENQNTNNASSTTSNQSGNANQQMASVAPKKIPYSGLKKIVAVSRFENRSSYASNGAAQVGTGMADQLTDSLIQSGAFVVLERQTIGDVIGEQDFANSGRVSKAQSARTGKITAAQVLVKGTITEFSLNNSGSNSGINIAGIKLGGGKSQIHVGLIIRLIDTTTGEVLASRRVEGKAIGSSSEVGLQFGNVGFSTGSSKSDPIGKAVQIAIDSAVEFIAAELRGEPYRGRVVRATKKSIVISAGGRNNAKPGDEFIVLGVGMEFKDPETGEILGREEEEIGRLRITKVKAKYSFAKPIGSFKTKAGDYVQAADTF